MIYVFAMGVILVIVGSVAVKYVINEIEYNDNEYF